MQNNLKMLREEKGLSQDTLAEMMGTTRNQLTKLESGARRLSDTWIARAAVALKVDPGQLVSSASTEVELRGLVGAGGLIEDDVSQVHKDGLVKVRLNISVSRGLSAYEVWGDSMLPKYEAGDVVVVEDEAVSPESALGLIVLVFTRDGRRYLKRLLRGSSAKLYNLESFNSSLMENVDILQVGIIHLSIPHNQVIHLHDKKPASKRKARRSGQIIIEAAE